jgi:hypothetical protein
VFPLRVLPVAEPLDRFRRENEDDGQNYRLMLRRRYNQKYEHVPFDRLSITGAHPDRVIGKD